MVSEKRIAASVRWAGMLVVLALLWKAAQAWRLAAGLHHHALSAFVKTAFLVLDGGLTVLWALFPGGWRAFAARLTRLVQRFGVLRWVGLVVWLLIFPYMVLYSPYTEKFAFGSVYWVLYLNFALGAAFFVASFRHTQLTLADALGGALLTGAVFAFAEAYTHVSAYPFPLSWSEGNRLWDYSVLFARDRYVYPSDQPIFAHTDIGRQFLWGLIYLVPGVNIFWARWWSAFLFTVPYLIFAWVVFLKPRHTRAAAFWAGLWGFLFLRQGPIYTPLLLSALAVAVAEMALPWWLGLSLIAGGAYYAAVTRYTWVFAPAFWAVILVAGETKRGAGWRDALKAKGWWLISGGLLGAILSGRLTDFLQAAWALVAKHLPGAQAISPGAGQSGSMAVRQPLIWSRLWPNPTFEPGILLGILLAVGPVFLLWWVWHRRGFWKMPRWAMMAIMAVLAVLLGMGVVISLKIGGGSNLHNLDMFLVSVVFVTVILWRQGGAAWLVAEQWRVWERVVLALMVLVPMYFVFLAAHPRNIPDASQWEPALRAVQAYVHEANKQGKDVLFMDQRQLLTFGYVEPTPLVVEYEKKYMMDKAMASDKEYFARYYHDLATHRFGVIITEPLRINYQPSLGNDFAAENNAWVRWVAVPTLCYYRVAAVFPQQGVEILVPRGEDEHLRCEQALPTPPLP